MASWRNRRTALVWRALIALGIGAGLSAAALAADPDRLGHYATMDGSVSFVLDRTGETPRQRYDGSPEILLLDPVAATRGDTIYRQSDGSIVLRSTPFGALTFFSGDHRTGVPLVRIGEAEPLIERAWTPVEVAALGPALAQHISLTHGLIIAVSVPEMSKLESPGALRTFAEAVENTQIAIDRAAAGPEGPADLARVLKAINYQLADGAGVHIKSGALIIGFAPRLEIEGRPSSYDIYRALNGAVIAVKANLASDRAGKPAKREQHSFDFEW